MALRATCTLAGEITCSDRRLPLLNFGHYIFVSKILHIVHINECSLSETLAKNILLIDNNFINFIIQSLIIVGGVLLQVKPSINQVNLDSCCVMPPELVEFAKECDIQLLTHSDPHGKVTAYYSSPINTLNRKPCQFGILFPSCSNSVIGTKLIL